MQLFECPSCSATLFFDSVVCESCQTDVSYCPNVREIVPSRHDCANRQTIGCNWTAEDKDRALCLSCRTTTMVPDLSLPETSLLWARSELAKRWVLANLSAWGWSTPRDLGPKPEFHLLAEDTQGDNRPVAMGHQNGVITINVAEADPIIRVSRREQFGEPYRTMIGHFRHELAHFFFFRRFCSLNGFIDEFRSVFGDERADYSAAISRYYEEGPSKGWRQLFVSEYASCHPHEDWAETFAHLLHLTDVADTFIAVGFSSIDVADKNFHPYRTMDSEELLSFAVDLAVGLNQLNRSMGLNDVYPFVLTPTVRQKIRFAHKWVSTGVAFQSEQHGRVREGLGALSDLG